jgi:hypothetical protein
MANFNLQALKRSGTPAASSSEGYNFLVDQIAIKRNQLEADGKLSPGDYKLLGDMAKGIYTNPSLSNNQRSNVAVQISDFESKSASEVINNTSDIDKLNRDVKETAMTAQSLVINNPELFLKTNADAVKAKIDRLDAIIDQKSSSFDHATKYQDERDEAMLDYLDALQALEDVETKNPETNYATYLITNSYGEVVDAKVGKIGSQSGYIPTNGSYGGLPIYGKINRINESGKNVFQLGNQKFIESQNIVSGPDGVSTQKKLLLEGTSNKGYATNAGYIDVDMTGIRSQNEIRRGGYALGVNGTIYKKELDGNYTKFVNTSPEKLGLRDGDLYRMSTSTEQSIIPFASNTVDDMAPPPLKLDFNGPTGPWSEPAGMSTQPGLGGQQQAPEAQPKGRPNTGGAPEERSPESASGIAGKAIAGVKGFLGGLFGK